MTEPSNLDVWRLLFNSTYDHGDHDADLVTVGWNSSFTGEPFTAGEMTEWVRRTVDRIRGLRPRRVLEIGCGVGLLARLLQDEVESYRGTDFSESALRRARGYLAPTIELDHQHAADFTGVEPRSRDTVVVNSVAQYFPDGGYLLMVLDGAVETTVDGGAVFLGDLRNKALLRAFHAAIELHRADNNTTADELRARAATRLAMEKELVIDPTFFRELASRRPRLSGVDILVKRGEHDTEMNCFRYDAILHVGPSHEVAAEPARLAWTSADEVAYHVTQRRPDTAVIAAVPNPRTARHVLAWQLIQDGGDTTARDLRALPADAIDPEFFPAWADRLGYDASVGWLLDNGGSGTYDVLLRRRGALAGLPDLALLGDVRTEPVAGPWYEPHVNQPHSHAATSPAVGGDGSVAGTIEAIWRQVLERDEIDPDANFFDLGGHSLLLVHMLQQLRTTVGPDLQLVDLFKHTTVRRLAARLGSRADDPADNDRRPPPIDRRRALRRQRDRRDTGVKG